MTNPDAFRALEPNPFDGCVLGRRTAIYGTNGSGKTTFSELLRRAARGEGDPATVATFRVDGSTSRVRLDGRFPLSFEVYNRFYVDESLALFLDGAMHGPPILKLGSQSVDTELAVRTLRSEASSLRTAAETLREQRSAGEKEIETLLKATKTAVIEHLGPGDQATYNSTRYTVAMARARLADTTGEVLDPIALDREIQVANSRPRDRIPRVASAPTWAANLAETVNEVIHAQVDSQPISELVADPELAGWINEGMRRHAPGTECGFCHDGVVSTELLERYARHFSAGLQGLVLRLEKAETYLTGLMQEVRVWEASLPAAENLLVQQRDTYAAARRDVAGKCVLLLDELAVAHALIERRLRNPSLPLPVVAHLTAEFEPIPARSVSDIVDDHNRDCDDQQKHKKEAQRKVECHHGALHRRAHSDLIGRVSDLSVQASEADLLASKKEDEAEKLENSQHDVGRMAVLLNDDLHEHFGFAHLSITVSDDRTGYVVIRDGSPAEHLSEGERHAISLAYFLRALEGEGVDRGSTVVVIDDPVTSLDKELLFSAYALVEERTKEFAQVVLLTHDFEYFRLVLLGWNSRMAKGARKRKERNSEELAAPSVSVLEAVSRIDAQSGVKSSRLRAIPEELVRHRSEYHYLFEKVAAGCLTPDPAVLPLLGNAGRRLLEGFLSFRAPSATDFGGAVEAVRARAGIDVAHAQRTVRFLHGQSHREEARPSSGLDFPAIVDELNVLLQFIRLADEAHFDSMCASVGIDSRSIGPTG